ncbi:MAG: alpha/beta hydrolase family protein, partial [Byssovorax sp.]
MFAERNGWAFIHPDFRGPYRRPEAAASDLVAQDILDAVEYAKQHANVDPSRIYLAGFSGGGMTALAMAGRRPDLWAGVAAWAPIHDLPDWYHYSARFPRRHYAHDISLACGGAPKPGTAAFKECQSRSPSALLDRARRAGVPVYIGCGLGDDTVPPEHAVRAYNQLANPSEQVPEATFRSIAKAALNLPQASTRAYARAGA